MGSEGHPSPSQLFQVEQSAGGAAALKLWCVGVRGPTPKPNRRNRTPLTHVWTEVEGTPNTSGPRLPARRRNGQPWPAHVRARWRVWRAMPHARLWQASDWEFAADTAELLARAAEAGGGSAALWNEIRVREKTLGTTWDARLGMRIRYVTPTTDDGPAASVTSPRLPAGFTGAGTRFRRIR